MSNPNSNWNNSNPQGGWTNAPRPDAGPYPYGQPPQGSGPYGQSPYGQPQPGQGYGMPNPAQHARPDVWQQPGMQRHTGPATDQSQAFMTKVFGWMTMGLGVTAVAAWMSFSTELLWTLMPFWWVLLLVELGLVFGIGIGVRKGMSGAAAIGAFLLYAALNGLTLAVIFAVYSLGSIAQVFLVTTMTFGFMFVFGWTTKKDLTGMGSLLFMALIGLIIASVVNMFVGGTAMSLAISVIGVIIFVGLTAYDAQKIKQMGMYGFADDNQEQGMAIVGALTLYLDFINLFIYLLRLLGDRR